MTAITNLNLQPGQPIELDTHTMGYLVVTFRGVRNGRLRFSNLSGPTHSTPLVDVLSVTGLHYN